MEERQRLAATSSPTPPFAVVTSSAAIRPPTTAPAFRHGWRCLFKRRRHTNFEVRRPATAALLPLWIDATCAAGWTTLPSLEARRTYCNLLGQHRFRLIHGPNLLATAGWTSGAGRGDGRAVQPRNPAT